MLTTIPACELPLFEIQAAHLPALIADPYSNELIDAKCHHCETVLRCRRIVAPFVACDPCIARIQAEERITARREHWLRICPPLFQRTDVNHREFPQAQYKEAKAIPLAKSLLLLGPSGCGKTRVAMTRMKFALLADIQVKAIWPEQLERYKGYDSEARIEALKQFGLVLLDDPLLTACRTPALADVLKNIIDILLRHEIAFIVTSQIGEEDFHEGKSFGDLKQSDRERGLAIMRRIKEAATVITFRPPIHFERTTR